MMQPSTFLFDLTEAAARSLALAAVAGSGLALLRTRNVLAQKAAWMLVLGAAVIMPFLAPWAAKIPGLPRAATVLIPQTWRTDTAKPERLAVAPPNEVKETAAAYSYSAAPAARVHRAAAAPAEAQGAPHFPAPSVSVDQASAASSSPQPAVPMFPSLNRWSVALIAYLAVCGFLLTRLAFGSWAALMLWWSAEPVDGAFPGLRVRISRGVASPVTVGSGIVLPAGALHWDSEKLRIVLAHEASHVRQRDFYLQILCSVYAAIFWFSPLGWWLKRKLSDLSETISDGAAVGHAASHVSYAQVLLEFAAMPRPVPIGVAMANHGRVTSRIEHLLNESRFRQAFAGGRARMACAMAIVALAVCAATLVRVQAATPQNASPAIRAVVAQSPGPAPAPAAQSTQPQTAPAPAPQVPVTPSTDPAVAPPPPAGPAAAPEAAPLAPVPDEQGSGSGAGAGRDHSWSVTSSQSENNANGRTRRGVSINSYGKGYAYSYHSNGDSYAIISGKDDVTFSGDWFEGRKAELDKARSMAHGNDFLWFTRNGKSYMLDDPTTVAQLKEMYKPMEDLGRQQEELGKQQEVLGRQQEELGRKQELASVPTPEMTREMAEVEKAMAALKAAKGQSLTQDKLADMQEKLAELQGKLGELQGRIGAKQGELGAQQGKLGELQGKLGAQQGKLGAEQGRIAVEADKKVKSVIDESLKNGKAKPVE